MDIALNIIVSILLTIIIVLFIIFSRKISAFNSSKKELAKFLMDFQSSINRAESNINELKEMGTKVDENLKSQIKKARFLANDLSFLTERGEAVADNLDNKVRRVSANPSKASSQDVETRANNVNMEKQTQQASSQQGNVSKKKALDMLLQQIAKKKEEYK